MSTTIIKNQSSPRQIQIFSKLSTNRQNIETTSNSPHVHHSTPWNPNPIDVSPFDQWNCTVTISSKDRRIFKAVFDGLSLVTFSRFFSKEMLDFLRVKKEKEKKERKILMVENSLRLNDAFFEEVKEVEKYACQPEPFLSAFLVPDIERSRRREFFRSALSDAHQAKRVRRFIYGCQTHTGVTVNAILNEPAWCCFASEGEIQTALGAAFQILHSARVKFLDAVLCFRRVDGIFRAFVYFVSSSCGFLLFFFTGVFSFFRWWIEGMKVSLFRIISWMKLLLLLQSFHGFVEWKWY